MPSREEIRELLLKKTEEITAGDLETLEIAARQADSEQDVEFAFLIRIKLHVSYADKELTHKSCPHLFWCLAKFNEDPKRFATWMEVLVWGFGGLTGSLRSVPEITLDQIHHLLEELEKFCLRCGFGQDVAFESRWCATLGIGDVDGARQIYDEWETRPCDPTTPADLKPFVRVQWLAHLDKHEQCVEAGRAFLAIPPALVNEFALSVVLATMLRSLALLGRTNEAEECHRKGYRLISGKANLLGTISHHLAYLGFSGKFSRGVSLAERHMKLGLEATELNDKFYLYLACASFFRRLSMKKSSCKLRLPRQFPLYSQNGVYDVKALAEWFEAQAAEIGERFNRRNGNDSFTRDARRELDY